MRQELEALAAEQQADTAIKFIEPAQAASHDATKAGPSRTATNSSFSGSRLFDMGRPSQSSCSSRKTKAQVSATSKERAVQVEPWSCPRWPN